LRTNDYYRELVACQMIPDEKDTKGEILRYGRLRLHSRA
jgi:hypothetical protein